MKRLLPIFLFFTSIMAVMGQKWALPSSVWKITESYSNSSHTYTFQVKVVGDTSILGQMCQKLSNGIVTFERNDTVFVHHQGNFHSVMYWNVNKNDTISIFDYYGVKAEGYGEPAFTDTVMAKITLIDSVDVGNKYLKQFHLEVISPSYIVFPNFTYAENIGGKYIFPYFHYNFIFDGDSYSLCNYGDSTIQDFYVYDNSCTNISIKEDKKAIFQLFPNPTADFIYLQLENTENIHYRITDITGKVVAQNTWNGQTISVQNLHSGVYFITLSHKNEILGTQKFVKL